MRFISSLALLLLLCGPTVHAAERTNLVFILTDNQGAWTLGCYGNQDIRTPNIDRLAAEGIRFTRALSCNPVCSPTRATFLTGLLPSQHGVHSFLDPKYTTSLFIIASKPCAELLRKQVALMTGWVKS